MRRRLEKNVLSGTVRTNKGRNLTDNVVLADDMDRAGLRPELALLFDEADFRAEIKVVEILADHAEIGRASCRERV